jgi:hypothetical protein
MNKCVLMIQLNNSLWQIKSSKGIVIADDIRINSVYQAEEFVKNYISSFQGWSYEVCPILKPGVKNA